MLRPVDILFINFILQHQRKHALNRKSLSRLIRIAVLAGSVFFALLALFVISIYAGAWGRLPAKKELSALQYQRATEVYTTDSVLIGKYYLHDRQPIPYEAFPPALVQALVAIEDERFYEHSGIDYRSLFRVAIKTLMLQDASAGGGSTLSQQLAKNLYPRERRGSFYLAVSKIKEMITAGRLENLHSKEALLEHYLNTVAFGGNTFGIESASLKFFNKRASELSVEEAATLIGMLKATHAYNPRIFPESSLQRRNLVLQAMVSNGYLSGEEKDSIANRPLKLNYREFDHNDGLAPYFREEVRKQLLAWNREQKEEGREYNIYTSGLKIYTTLDYRMQVLAEEAMVSHMAALQEQFEKSHGGNAPWLQDRELIRKTVRRSAPYKKLVSQGLSEAAAWDSLARARPMTLASWDGEKEVAASVIDSIQHYMKFLNVGSLAIDPGSGAVKTWIGGVEYKYFKYDHISQSKRQVGSTFKPIVYTAALESGIAPCTHFSAQEVVYKNLEDWSPGNSAEKDELYLNYSMQEALSKSVNTVAVKVLEETGIPKVLQQARNMGISSPLPALPSLALGTGSIGLDELAGAYASYVNSGRPVKPYLIRAIADSRDSILQRFGPGTGETRAFSESTGAIMLEFMKATVNEGTASRLRSQYGLTNDMAGKTGTTQNNKDAWFVGITPRLVHVSWVGLENHEIGFPSTALGQGANAALPLFALFMKKLNATTGYEPITRARFQPAGPEIMKQLDCEPVKRDGFFKRLFKNPNKKKSRKFQDGS